MKTRRVAVVGAGIAGLGAATELARRGFDVTLLEQGPRAGGRAVGETSEGFALEPDGGAVSTSDRRLLAWIDRVGVRDDLLPLRPVRSAQVHDGRVRPEDPRGGLFGRPPGVPLVDGLRLGRLPRLLRRYGRFLDPNLPERAAPLDDRSLADFGRLYFGRSAVDYGFAPFLSDVTQADPRDISRALFLLRWSTHADARVGLLRAPLAELADAAAGLVETRTGVEVRAVEEGRRGTFELALLDRGRERRLRADAVVLATDAHAAARLAAPLLSPVERDFLSTLRYEAGIALAVALVRPTAFHPQRVRIPRAEGIPIDLAVQESGLRGGRAPDGRGLATLRARGDWSADRLDVPDDVVEKEMLSAWELLSPGFRGAVQFTRLFRDPRATPRYGVGAFRDLARFGRAQADLRGTGRRLYFAGDYLMGPGLEAALASGLRAAGAASDDLATAPSRSFLSRRGH